MEITHGIGVEERERERERSDGIIISEIRRVKVQATC